MAPELVQFHDEQSGRMTVRTYNLSTNPGIAAFPIRVVPTQFFFNADGSPYRPQDFAIGGSFELVTDEAGTHVLTKHEGFMSADDMTVILDDMTAR